MTTLTFDPVPNFDLLSLEESVRYIYDVLLPACEAKGIYLSAYGNHKGNGSLGHDIQLYESQKTKHELFDVQRIREVFTWARRGLNVRSTFRSGSYGLKHEVEKLPGQRYTANGELIVALLLHGYSARFGKRGKGNNVNCDFKVEVAEKRKNFY